MREACLCHLGRLMPLARDTPAIFAALRRPDAAMRHALMMIVPWRAEDRYGI